MPVGRRGTAVLLAAPLAFLLAFAAAPLVEIVRTSAGGFGPAVRDPLFAAAVIRTVLIAVTVTVACVVLGTAYALALAVTRGRLRTVLLGVLVASFWMSLLVRTLGWVLLLEPAGLLERVLQGVGLLHGPLNLLQTTAGMYPAMIHIMLPYLVLPVYAAVAAVDARQVRAARSLGASPLLVLRSVVLPQIRAGIVGGGVLVFTLSLGFYVTPAFLGGPEDMTLGTLIGRDLMQATGTGFAPAAAIAVMLVVSVLAVYAVADRLLRISDTWGST